jgi:REP element-mobilizing transposase RayT
MRTVPGTWNLRTKRCFLPIHQALAAHAEKNPDCRVVHFSVQGNHLHLIVEAEHARALTAGIKGLAVRLARRLNRVMGRRGRVFTRYHAEALTTPRRVRNALSYVLNNLRRHAAQWGGQPAEAYADPYSSARWFDGWREPDAARDAVATGPPWLAKLEGSVGAPRTWLLRTGWRRHGAVSMGEVPGRRG